MKYLLVSVLALVIVFSSVIGCSPAEKNVIVAVSCDDFRTEKNVAKEVQLAAGNKLEVSLCQQSASTGYSWPEKALLGDAQVLEQTGFKTVPPEKPIPGAPGTNVWTFRALQPGKCVIDLDYSQQWKGGEKGGWTLKLTVNVK